MRYKRMQLRLATYILILLFVVAITKPVYAEEQTSIVFTIGSNEYLVNGTANVMDVAPFTQNNRTYLPVRYVAEALGVSSDNITYDGSVVTITKGDKVIKLYPGSPLLTVNGTPTTMDVNVFIVSGRTMLPVRWVAEAFGATVTWNGATQSVYVNYSDGTTQSSPANNSSLDSNVRELPGLSYPATVRTMAENYEWKYNNVTYKWHVEIPADLFDTDVKVFDIVNEFRSDNLLTQNSIINNAPDDFKGMLLSLRTHGDFTWWVNEPANNTYIKYIAQWLSKQASSDRYDYMHTAEFAESFVGGALLYEIDAIPELPAKTLVDNGDCKNKSILLASILKNMGYNVALLNFDPLPNQPSGHEAVGIAFDDTNAPTNTSYTCNYYLHDGLKYYYTETTMPNWHIGQMPDMDSSGLKSSAYVYPID